MNDSGVDVGLVERLQAHAEGLDLAAPRLSMVVRSARRRSHRRRRVTVGAVTLSMVGVVAVGVRALSQTETIAPAAAEIPAPSSSDLGVGTALALTDSPITWNPIDLDSSEVIAYNRLEGASGPGYALATVPGVIEDGLDDFTSALYHSDDGLRWSLVAEGIESPFSIEPSPMFASATGVYALSTGDQAAGVAETQLGHFGGSTGEWSVTTIPFDGYELATEMTSPSFTKSVFDIDGGALVVLGVDANRLEPEFWIGLSNAGYWWAEAVPGGVERTVVGCDPPLTFDEAPVHVAASAGVAGSMGSCPTEFVPWSEFDLSEADIAAMGREPASIAYMVIGEEVTAVDVPLGLAQPTSARRVLSMEVGDDVFYCRVNLDGTFTPLFGGQASPASADPVVAASDDGSAVVAYADGSLRFQAVDGSVTKATMANVSMADGQVPTAVHVQQLVPYAGGFAGLVGFIGPHAASSGSSIVNPATTAPVAETAPATTSAESPTSSSVAPSLPDVHVSTTTGEWSDGSTTQRLMFVTFDGVSMSAVDVGTILGVAGGGVAEDAPLSLMSTGGQLALTTPQNPGRPAVAIVGTANG